MKHTQNAAIRFSRRRPDLAPGGVAALSGAALLFSALAALTQAVCGVWSVCGWLCLLAGAAALIWQSLAARLAPKWAALALPAACLLLAVIFGAQMQSGWSRVYNSACEVFGAALGRYFLRMPEAQQSAVLFGVLLAALLGCLSAALQQHRALCAGVLSVLAATVAGIVHSADAALPLGLCVLASALLLAGGKPMPGGSGTLLRAQGAVTLAAALLALVLCAVPALRDGGAFSAWSASAEQSLHAVRYEEERLLPEGDFTNLPENNAEAPALKVTMESPTALYLRGFTGDTFTGSGWTAPETQMLMENGALLYWLHRGGFYPQTQLSAAADAMPQAAQTQSVFVENTGACRAYCYTPYALRTVGGSTLTETTLESSTLPAPGAWGASSYRFEMLAEPETALRAALEYYSAEPDAEGYLSEEGSYRALVRELDLSIPDEALGQLKPLLDECCAAYGAAETLTAAQAQDCALIFLDRYVIGRETEAELPLDTLAKGPEYQTATLAALALRYYGVPARYAEGFVLTKAAADRANAGEAILLTAADAHAWTEVYQDGIGWVPMELTPGYGAVSGALSAEASAQLGLSGTQTDGAQSLPQAREPQDEQPEQSPQDEQPDRAPHTAQPLVWLIVLGSILLLLALLALRYVWSCRRRQRRFEAAPPQAVGWVTHEVDRLLPLLGLSRAGGSLYALCDGAQALEEGYGEALGELARLNGEALFSSHPMTPEQAQWARDFWTRSITLVRKKCGLPKRLWARFVRCLY